MRPPGHRRAVTLALLFGLFNLIFGIWMLVQGIELRHAGKTLNPAAREKAAAWPAVSRAAGGRKDCDVLHSPAARPGERSY